MANQYKTISDMFTAFTEKFAPIIKKRVFDLDAKDMEKFAQMLDKYLDSDKDEKPEAETQAEITPNTETSAPAPGQAGSAAQPKVSLVNQLTHAVEASRPKLEYGAIIYNRALKKIGTVLAMSYAVPKNLSLNADAVISPESIIWTLRVQYITKPIADSLEPNYRYYAKLSDVDILIPDPKCVDKAKLAKTLVTDIPYLRWVGSDVTLKMSSIQYVSDIQYVESTPFNLKDFYINNHRLSELVQLDATLQNEPVIQYIAETIKSKQLYID